MSDNATLDELEAEEKRRSEDRKQRGTRAPGKHTGGRGRRTNDPTSRRFRPEYQEQPAAEPAQPGISAEQLDAMLDASLEELADLPVLLWKMPPACSPDEKRQFRAATKPVLLKHMGELLTNFGVEITCAITLFALYKPRWDAKRDRERNQETVHGGTGERKDVPRPSTITTLHSADRS